jgi:hypothetical protein
VGQANPTGRDLASKIRDKPINIDAKFGLPVYHYGPFDHQVRGEDGFRLDEWRNAFEEVIRISRQFISGRPSPTLTR